MILKVENLCKNFGNIEAVRGLNFTIETGRCIALLGPNGAGKTTTLQMLAGLMAPTAGTIRFQNINNVNHRQQIGFLPQYPSFYDWMTPAELLTFVGKLSGLKATKLNEQIAEILVTVGLEKVAGQRIGGFSGGMKQRLGIAQALLHKPKLILLDEPISSLDPVGRREIINLLHKLKHQTTIFFSTHVLHDAEAVSDEIFIMKDGQIKVSGSLTELKQSTTTVVLKIKTAEKTEKWLPNIETGITVFQETPYFVHLTIPKAKVATVKNQLLQQILNKSVTLLLFQETESTLEDLFMKVVTK